MIKVINIVLIIICIILAVLLGKSLLDPINIKKDIDARNEAVHQKLYEIRDAQEVVKSVKGTYAPSFDSLKTVLKNDSFRIKRFNSTDTIVTSILDSVYNGNVDKINNMSYVPNSNGEEFKLEAGVLPNPNDSTIFIPVFEASTLNTTYLKGINEDYWFKNQKVKVGSMTAPILRGNWE